MSCDRSISALTDEEHRLVAAAEQDLDRLISLQPSPEFAAKVRARVREHEPRAWWRGGWARFAAVATSVVVIAGIALLMATMREEPAVHQAPVQTQAAAGRDVSLRADTPGMTSRIVTADTVSRSAAPGSRIAPRPSRMPSAGLPAHVTAATTDPQSPASPDVLIDPRRRDAVNRLLAMVRSGITGLPAATPETQELTVSPVVVEQLEVPLLLVGGGSN